MFGSGSYPGFRGFANTPQERDELAKTGLEAGDNVPDFSLLSDEWKPVKLSDYRGKKNEFLDAYALAFAGG